MTVYSQISPVVGALSPVLYGKVLFFPSSFMLKKQTVAAFNQLTAGKQDDYEALQKQRAEIVKKIDRLEEWYIEEEIGNELYRKFPDKYTEERRETEEKLIKLSKQVSNLNENVGFALKFALELP